MVDVPEILEELATVEMHASPTSGKCIRNVTADHFAGAAADEIEDPRVYGEIISQWSSLHPAFSLLPRKFKYAVTGAPTDRSAERRAGQERVSTCRSRRSPSHEHKTYFRPLTSKPTILPYLQIITPHT